MSKRKPRGVFAKMLCVGARSGIVLALYLATFLAALQLAAFLPEPWTAVAITALILVVGLALLGRWPGHQFRLESVGLGYQLREAGESSGSANLAEERSSAIHASLILQH
jgi:hypothetical protein